ncbi:hypothetical protein KTN05_07565, partial [Paracoccus sp. Z118]|uniref:hypothetical protein n=1 Tax=Paracoccus sp. Z118 TaxID=2851017 RepID=UPI001C2C7D3A
SAMAASVTPGRALRYAGAPRAASYTNRWDTAEGLARRIVAAVAEMIADINARGPRWCWLSRS